MDLNGNYLALDVVIDKQKLTLLSLYGPSMDNPDFYDQIMNIIEDFGNERYLLCGDFNLVLCHILIVTTIYMLITPMLEINLLK